MGRALGEFEPGRLGACSPPSGFESWYWGVGGRSGHLATPLLSGVSALTQSAISAKIRQAGIARVQVGDESRFRTMAAPLQGVVRPAELAREVMHAYTDGTSTGPIRSAAKDVSREGLPSPRGRKTGRFTFRVPVTSREVATRAAAVISRIETLIAMANPKDVPVGILDDIFTVAQAVQSAVSQPIPWTPAVATAIDTSLRDLTSLGGRLLPLVLVVDKALQQKTVAAAAAARHAAQDLESRISSLAAELDALRQKQTEAATKVDLAATGAASTYTARLTDVDAKIDSVTASTGQAISAFNQTSESALSTQRAEFNLFTSAAEDALTQLQAKYDVGGSEILDDLNAKRDEIAQLYRVITNTGTAGAFQAEANEQQAQANLFRWLGLLCIVIAVGVAGFIAIAEPSLAWNSGGFVSKVAIAVALGATATYLVRQSGYHRALERRNRWLELELVALPPFVEDLSEAARETLKQQFVGRAFRGQDVNDGDDKTESASLSQDDVTLFSQIVDVVKRFR
jgi:hypothetical protein